MSKTIEHVVEGNPDGPTLLFIHGWPDNASLWRKQVEVLRKDFRCVLLTLPNYGDKAKKAGGYDFPQIIEQLAATIRKIQPEGRVGLITHDWGAYLGYLLEQSHPDLIDRMAALDVGGHVQPSGLKEPLMIMGYQWALVLSWLVGGLIPPLGKLMTRGVARVVRVPSRQRENIRSRYNYLYFYMWRALLLPWQKDKLLRRYRPRCPVLYLYGARKPLMFHSEKWIAVVAESGGKSAGIEGAGHWLMETHAGEVNPKLLSWFREQA